LLHCQPVPQQICTARLTECRFTIVETRCHSAINTIADKQACCPPLFRTAPYARTVRKIMFAAPLVGAARHRRH
jgi:hypothetical protein